MKQNPKGAGGYAVFGWCLYKLGRADEAERAYNLVISGGQITSDSAYFIARLLADKQRYEDAHKLLAAAVGAKHGLFVYRADAKVLLAEVAKKVPAKPEEPKKP